MKRQPRRAAAVCYSDTVQPGLDAYLLLESNQGTKRFPLNDAQSWSIGRSFGCAILLDSRSVSRLHALIQRLETGEYCLVDLGSLNGSLVNGRRVSIPQALRDGDRLVCGDQQLVFRFPSQSAAKKAAQLSWRELPTSAMYRQSQATILVVDIRDFTPFARTVSEAVLSQTIGTWFLKTGDIVQKWGSWGQKYIGDAVMAVWAHESEASMREDLLDALHALAGIRRITAELHQKLPLPQPLRIGAGINTGQAIIGSTDYTALGDTVNAAFRLEAATKQLSLDVAMGQSTFGLLSGGSEEQACFERREVELKGYETPAIAWATSFDRLEQFLAQNQRQPREMEAR